MEANPFQNEKLSIKNLLFTKAIPNYTLPIPTDGRPLFVCTDCGDKFIIKSSFEFHIKRKSLKITYFCRHCNVAIIFYNRCDLLSHIRSHAFKTATISISDLKIEPLPLSFYKYRSQISSEIKASLLPLSNQEGSTIQCNKEQTFTCFDCNENIFSSGIVYRDRAKHYTQYTNKVYSCPICLVTLTTRCALEAHLRIHTKEQPIYCPDCGIYLSKRAVMYPYSHDCESFNMMRAVAKVKCLVNSCKKIFHPNEMNKHFRNNHLKHVYKCPSCSVACYKLDNMLKHLNSFHMGKFKQLECKKIKHIDFLQCEMCPGRLVIPGQIEKHLSSHVNSNVNLVCPCWTCGATFKSAKSLLDHQKGKHPDSYLNKILGKVSHEHNATNLHNMTTISSRGKSTKCEKCFRNNESQPSINLMCNCRFDTTPKIVCHLCQATVIQDWNIIKKHYATYHREHVCLDAKILIKKLGISNQYKKNRFKKRKTNRIKNKSCDKYITPERSQDLTISLNNNKLVCIKCGQKYENKQSLEKHIVEHRDPFMAYQCMECGESFIAKPSFSKHLLLNHGINDVNSYIDQKKCYSKDSLNVQEPINNDESEPFKENQCNICREQFSNSNDFEKHFRVHGMAFLMKNTNKPISPETM